MKDVNESPEVDPQGLAERPNGQSGSTGTKVAIGVGAAAVVAVGAIGVTKLVKGTPTSSIPAGSIRVNGVLHKIQMAGDTPLLYVLRDELELKGPKFGCGLGQCGACAVLVGGTETRSCLTPVSKVTADVTTLEGLPAQWAAQKNLSAAEAAKTLHPLQQAWIDQQVPQCGYCQSGMLIQAADLLSKTKNPSETQIRTAMNGHLCRCGTYPRIITAIQKAAAVMAK
jgi:aerobic-type carbon monoxide dehydrogenase small subunit (CoxS/CutS family)